ncbi:MAG: transcriptional repressor LexA [Varibaculum sp.]|nr:transcriptional repressor LexA [Varibaculum sp.]
MMNSDKRDSGTMNPAELRPRTRAVYDALTEAIRTLGYPPSVRELAETVGLSSPATVKHHLDILENLGYIHRGAGRSRAIELVDMESQQTEGSSPHIHLVPVCENPESGDSVSVPLVGQIAAGAPITAEQHIEDSYALPRQLTGSGELFMLQVRGDSMIDAAICDGDYVVVRSQPSCQGGDIVAALLDDEATVKTLSYSDGHQWLLPQNPAYEPILGDYATIMGRVVTVLRSL